MAVLIGRHRLWWVYAIAVVGTFVIFGCGIGGERLVDFGEQGDLCSNARVLYLDEHTGEELQCEGWEYRGPLLTMEGDVIGLAEDLAEDGDLTSQEKEDVERWAQELKTEFEVLKTELDVPLADRYGQSWVWAGGPERVSAVVQLQLFVEGDRAQLEAHLEADLIEDLTCSGASGPGGKGAVNFRTPVMSIVGGRIEYTGSAFSLPPSQIGRVELKGEFTEGNFVLTDLTVTDAIWGSCVLSADLPLTPAVSREGLVVSWSDPDDQYTITVRMEKEGRASLTAENLLMLCFETHDERRVNLSLPDLSVDEDGEIDEEVKWEATGWDHGKIRVLGRFDESGQFLLRELTYWPDGAKHGIECAYPDYANDNEPVWLKPVAGP